MVIWKCTVSQPFASPQASLAVSELSNRNSPGVNGVIGSNNSRCNNVRNSGTVAVSSVKSVSAQSETYVDTSQ